MFKNNSKIKLNKELINLNLNFKKFINQDLFKINDDNSITLLNDKIKSYKDLSILFNQNYSGSIKLINIYYEFKNLLDSWKELKTIINDNNIDLYSILSYYDDKIEILKKNKLYFKILKLFIKNIYSFKIISFLLYDYYNKVIIREKILLNNIINNINNILIIINNYNDDKLYEIIYHIINIITNYSNYTYKNNKTSYIILKGIFIKISEFTSNIFRSKFIVKIIDKVLNNNKNIRLYNKKNIYDNYIEIFLELLYNAHFINKYIIKFYTNINKKISKIYNKKTKNIFNYLDNKNKITINNTNNFGFYDNEIQIFKSYTKNNNIINIFNYTNDIIKNFEKIYTKNKPIKIPFFIKNNKITDKVTTAFINSFSFKKIKSLKNKKNIIKTFIDNNESNANNSNIELNSIIIPKHEPTFGNFNL